MLDSILIVDGDSFHKEQLKKSIAEKLKYKTASTSNIHDATQIIFNAQQPPALLLIDMRLSKEDCLRMIRLIKSKMPELPIITLVEYGNHACALEAIESGANDFLTKPFTIERLGLSIASAMRIANLCKMVSKLEQQLEADNKRISLPSPYSITHSPQFGRDVKIKKLRHLEEDAILFALNVCGGSMSKAARSLGIGRSTLYRKVGELQRHKHNAALSNQILRENHTTRPKMVTSEMEHS